jgi:hypothetical protein
MASSPTPITPAVYSRKHPGPASGRNASAAWREAEAARPAAE